MTPADDKGLVRYRVRASEIHAESEHCDPTFGAVCDHVYEASAVDAHLAAIEEECKRLREALKQIANTEGHSSYHRVVARAALSPSNEVKP